MAHRVNDENRHYFIGLAAITQGGKPLKLLTTKTHRPLSVVEARGVALRA